MKTHKLIYKGVKLDFQIESPGNQTAYVTKIINKAQIESSLDQQTISTQSRSVEASFHQENTQIAKSLNEQTLGSQQLSSNEVVRDEASGQAEKIETEIVETLLDIFLEGVSIIIDVMDDDD